MSEGGQQAIEATGPVGRPLFSAPGARSATPAADVEQLFVAQERRLGQFLAQIVGSRSQAEDLLQETFLVAWREREIIASIENPEAWLFAVARNRALHAMRGMGRARAAYERLGLRRIEKQSDPADAIGVRDFLARNLKADDRILVVLHYVHGFTSGELGVITGRSPEAVRQRLSRARRRLAQALDGTSLSSSPDQPSR